MATLDILSGKGAGTTIDLDQFAGKDRIVLGNRRTAAVPVRDPWVNFVHAEIHREGDSFRLADKRSKAGTFVNGEPVGTVGKLLSNGDMIALGKTELRFKDANASAAPKEAPGAAPAAAKAAAPAPAPAGIGGMKPHAGGPFTPSAPLTGDARLTAELQRAKNEASSLRQAIVARERELAKARNELRAAEGADPEALKAARAEAAHAQTGLAMAQQQVVGAHAVVEETKQQARIKIEELTRLNQALEMRLAQGGAADTVALEREIARLREEGRKVQDQGRRRIDQLSLEKAALEAQLSEAQAVGGPNPELEAKLAEAEARAEAAEATQDELEDRLGGIQSASRELELELEDLRAQLASATADASANAASGDETQALEAAIAELNEDLAAAKDARREALQALQQKDEEVAALRGASGGGSGVDPAQLIALRNSLAKLEEQNAALEKQNTSLQDKLAVAEARSEESGALPAGAAESAELAAAQAALASAQAELEAARAAAPAAAEAGGGDDAQLQARIATLEEDNASLLRDLEEINEDMLAQEEEYQTRITELEAQLGS